MQNLYPKRTEHVSHIITLMRNWPPIWHTICKFGGGGEDIMKIAFSGIEAVRHQISEVSNNIANTSSTGFKSGQSAFAEIYGVNTMTNHRTVIGNGTAQISKSQKMDQGAIVGTGGSLDLAITGTGLFAMGKIGPNDNENTIIENPFFSRNGSFSLSSEGYIINTEGDVLLTDSKRPMRFPYIDNYVHTSQYQGDLNLSEISNRTDTLINSSLSFTTPSTEHDLLYLKTDDRVGVTDGDLSLVEGEVYHTENGIVHHIGSYDTSTGKTINIKFFDQSNISSSKIFSDFTDENTWTQVNDRYFDGVSSINGNVMPDVDTTSPANAIDGDQVEDRINFVDTSSFEIIADKTERISELNIKNTTVTQRFGIFKGPYVHTKEPLKLEAGSNLSFSYNVDKNAADQADALGFIFNTDTGETTKFFDETIKGTSDWQNVEFAVTESGVYDVIFVGGAFDSTGGTVVSSSLKVKDFSVDNVLDKIYKTPSTVAEKLEDRLEIGIKIINENSTYDAPNNIGVVSQWSNLEDYFQIDSEYELDRSETEFLRATIDDFDAVNISSSGKVIIDQQTDTGFKETTLGKIGAISYLDMNSLKYASGGRYDAAVPLEKIMIGDIRGVGGGDILQGALEQSNVDLMAELSSLIENQLIFNANSKAIQAYMEAGKMLRDVQIS